MEVASDNFQKHNCGINQGHSSRILILIVLLYLQPSEQWDQNLPVLWKLSK